MWRLYTLHNVRRTLSYITLSKYVHYLICTLLMYNKILQTMYDEKKRDFNTHINCDEAGKKLILTAFPNMYTSALEDYLLGYAGVTVRELVQYIIHTYSRIDPTQLADCYTEMTGHYDLQDPIETLFTQIDDGVRYALAGGQPYGEAQHVNIAFLLILATQSLPLACTEWQRRVTNMQTWPLFKAFFTEAHHENHMISQTALRSGYHTANMVTQITAGQFESCDVFWHYTQPNDVPDANPDTTTALANLAMATGANRATVSALTKSLAELTAVSKAHAEELRRLIHSDNIDPLTAQSQHTSTTVVRGNGRQRRSGNNEQVSGTHPLYKTKNNNYCWSHGYQVGLQHTSATCIERKAGHNPAATKSNIMGGDTWGSEFLWRGGQVKKANSVNNIMTYLNSTPPNNLCNSAILDSGATGNFLAFDAPCDHRINPHRHTRASWPPTLGEQSTPFP
jgi:hypothetical protein